MRNLLTHPEVLTATDQPIPERSATALFAASFVTLFFELIIIRYLSTEIRAFAYLKNLPLIASFFGIGLGMIMAKVPSRLRTLFPFVALLLFALVRFAAFFHLTHIPMPRTDYVIWGAFPDASRIVVPLRFLGDVLSILCLIVAFFVVLGGIAGEEIAKFEPLAGYGINLAGSLAGVAVFPALGILSLPPIAWLVVGMLCLLPFFRRSKVAVLLLLLTAALTYTRDRNTFWSPYYRIDLHAQAAPEGWPKTPAYELEVNHDFHQHILDLSTDFVSRYPAYEPNASARLSYEIPYLVAAKAKEVLVVGAGTGNDVAAALRHGCDHVDAVEIDPVILKLGKESFTPNIHMTRCARRCTTTTRGLSLRRPESSTTSSSLDFLTPTLSFPATRPSGSIISSTHERASERLPGSCARMALWCWRSARDIHLSPSGCMKP